jgi:predicted methyltransferase
MADQGNWVSQARLNITTSVAYRELYCVLKQRGVLFHYTGEPGKHCNFSVVRGVKDRLEKSRLQGIRV